MAIDSSRTLQSIWRFPVKGLKGQTLSCCNLAVNASLPGDREYAITTGSPITHEKLDAGWMNKRHFIQLCATSGVVGWQLLPDEAHEHLILLHHGTEIMRAPANAATPLMEALYQHQPEIFSGQPRLCRMSGDAYTDTPAPWISLGGSASLADFGKVTSTPPDNRRFRLNLIIETETPFEELDWAGRIMTIGSVILEIIEPVGRCAAINVDPDTAKSNTNLLGMMRNHYNHSNLGMFARITTAGKICCGDRYQLAS